ncbi:RES family NAD+ phosphorylase [Pseudomonas fragi]|uniref:RES domain-containing protein n=1 Tax=Pseudomonas fragi TaxID=296 RepID=UPI0014729563|nr:RES family NAD+ phosphorylase [Pseudomonas fragi]NNB38673.1 RES family NAD+ phosphorylase [Pseudomonas fragi]
MSVQSMFEVFDDEVGASGYYQMFRSKLFPNSAPDSVDVAAFQLEGQIFRKGSSFSRVRRISIEQAGKFVNGDIIIDDFYPPKPHKVEIPQGRFNEGNRRVLYLAQHPFVAMKECEVELGEYFLLSYIKLSVDMCFFRVVPGLNEFTDMMHRLLTSTDKKFYPVINRISDEMLRFRGFHGIAYDSVKVPDGHSDQKWGPISSSINIAVSGEYIRKTEIDVAWLSYCGDEFVPYWQAMYRPLSNKKKNKITCLSYWSDKALFIEESSREQKRQNMNTEKIRRLLDRGYYADFSQPPVKVLVK